MSASTRSKAAGALAGLSGTNYFETETGFMEQGIMLAQMPLLIRAQAIAAQTTLRKSGQFSGQFERCGQRSPGLAETVDETHAAGLFAGDTAAGEDQIHRMAVTDQPGQTHGATIYEGYPPTSTIDTKYRISSSYPKVTPDREFQPAGNGMTFYRRNNRLAEQHA